MIEIKQLRILFLTLSKWLGGFIIARHITSHGLRILCYHGVSIEDEHLFRPSLFITREIFQERMRWLRRSRFPILHLAEAVERLRSGSLPPYATVITFDDGWYSSLIAANELSRHRLPATFYISSYYVKKQEPIFNLFVAYALWRARRQAVPLNGRNQTQTEIVQDSAKLGSAGRIEIMKRVAELTDVDYETVAASRRLGLMNEIEVARLASDGFNIELHTHRHHLDGTNEQLCNELCDNRIALEPIVGRPLEHFCYPSGRYSLGTFEILRQQGVKSAATCDVGFNYHGTDPLALRRILDSVTIPQIVFEAEMSGFMEILRFFKRRLAPSNPSLHQDVQTTKSAQSYVEPKWRERVEKLNFEFGPFILVHSKFRALSLVSNPFIVPPDLTVPLQKAIANGCRGVARDGLAVNKNSKMLCFEYGGLRYAAHYGVRYVVDLDCSFESYLTRFSKKSRGNLRRTVKRFAAPETGAPEVREYRSPAEIAIFRGIAIAISHRSYKTERGWGFPEDSEFAEQLAQDAAAGLVRGYVLMAGKEAAAFVFCRIDHDVIIYKNIGYDEQFYKMSPGTALLYMLLENLFRIREFRLLDFDGSDEYPYKKFFATRQIPCVRVYWFPPTIANILLVGTHCALTTASRIGAAIKRQLTRPQTVWSSARNPRMRRLNSLQSVKSPSSSG